MPPKNRHDITRFPNGVTTVNDLDILSEFGLPDLTGWHIFYEDFDRFTEADWTTTTTFATGPFATGVLTFTGVDIVGDTFIVGTTLYTAVTALSTGPTVVNEVLVTGDADTFIDNLVNAINGDTTDAGVGYSFGTIINPDVSAVKTSALIMTATARTAGTAGNALKTAGTITNGAWGAALMTGGLATATVATATVDDAGAVVLNTVGAVNTDQVTMQLPNDSFIIETGKKLFFKVRWQENRDTNSEVILGLMSTASANLFAPDDGLWISKVQGNDAYRLEANATAGSDSVLLSGSEWGASDINTYSVLGIYWDGIDTLYVSDNGGQVVSVIPGDALPTDVDLSLTFGALVTNALAVSLSIDYILVASERTGATE